MLQGCSTTPPVVRTETVSVPKLEYVPLPDEAVEPCIVPLPPVDAAGVLPYESLPGYTVQILAVLEECNERIKTIEGLQPEVAFGDWRAANGPNTPVAPESDYEKENIQIRVFAYENLATLQQQVDFLTNYQYTEIIPYLRGLSWYATVEGRRICRIYVVRPKLYKDDSWESWGHELGHCVYGQWHNDEDWR